MSDRVLSLVFLRYCIDDRLPLPESAKRIDWRRMMAWAEQQAIVGIIYGGIQRAGKSLGIPFDVLMEWVGYANQIELQDKLVNKRCVELVEEFRKDGFECLWEPVFRVWHLGWRVAHKV